MIDITDKGAEKFDSVLKPGQWDDLLARLGEIDNPTVPTKTSKFAIPVEKHRSSDAHQGE